MTNEPIGMTKIHTRTQPLPDLERGRRIFAGDLLVFSGIDLMARLVTMSEELITKHLGGDPEQAHQRLDAPTLTARIDELTRCYRNDRRVRATCAQALAAAGADVTRLCWDWLHLRVQPPRGPQSSGTLGFHRDTWSSHIYAQTNWWAPIYPITAQRTLAFYPSYWTRALTNTSATWDLERLHELPPVPAPDEPVDTGSEVRIVIPPGDLLCFSGAHLHASVPNDSQRIRFSVEVRTVNLDDLAAGRCAPNVDGAAPHAAWRWFRSVTSGVALPQLVASPPQP